PEGSEITRRLGHRAILAVPLIRGQEAIEAIFVQRTEVRSFTDQQIVAIENTRLFEEVQARTRELQRALEQQTATSEVLDVVSRSPGKLDPVFQAMLANAVRLSAGKFGMLWPAEGDDHFRSAETCRPRPEGGDGRQGLIAYRHKASLWLRAPHPR